MDNHYYEPDDAFTRHLPVGYTGPRLHVVRRDDGPGVLYFGDQPSTYMQAVPTDRVARPGMFAVHRDDRVAVSATLGPDDMVEPRKLLPYMDREARVAWMDGQGIDASVLWPSVGLTVEPQMRTDPVACVANLRAFNRWIDEQWGFDRDGRIFAAPFLTLVDLDEALVELDTVLAAGARLVHLLCAPVAGRSLADPSFDAFWARMEEAGVPVAFHAVNPGYCSLLSTHWGELANPTPEQVSAFQRFAFWVERAIVDTVGALILHNLFGRFPRLQVVVVELGSEWVPHTLDLLDRSAKGGRTGRWLGGPVTDAPSDIFRAHFRVAPFCDEDIDAVVAAIGWDRIVLGSDFPHPEGLATPWAFFDHAQLDLATAVQVARTNAEPILGDRSSAVRDRG
jgi:predicted TIM-barrel fold metal-dependent hydrolase